MVQLPLHYSYITLHRQPHVRQLFGFTESQDFLGLVFHEHSLPVHEAWAEMTPIQRVFADAQFYFDWNEALDSLADISLFRGLVDEINWDGVTQEESGPLILLHIIFSTDSQDSQPASRYALFSSLSLLKSNQRWVQHFRNAPLSSWKHASTTDILRFYSLVDATASTDTRRYPFSKASTPQFPIRISPFSKAGVTASRSTFPTFNIARWITRYVAVTHLQLSSQSVPLSWSWISVPTNTQTVLLNGYCNLAPEEPLYLTALRHIPDIWNSGKRSFKSQCRDIKLEYGMDSPNPIFLISCAELRLPLDGPLTPQELGFLDLLKLDLSRSGLAITFGSARVVDSRVLSEFAIKAATQVSGSLDSDLVEFPLAPQRWPRHLQTRSSSVDRYMKYPNSRIRRYPHPHTFCPPVHSALVLLRSAGFTHPYRDWYDPKLHRERCPCYDSSSSAQRKRRRAKSVDTACRVTQYISRWISLMEITEMTQQDIQAWYLESSFDPIRYRDIPTGPKRSGISPWTVLVDLSEEERGRSPNRRDRD
ncbi:hypothetical protein DL96DRAFT_1581874 [Flagelloscypha sp. PMI_526]|nr:hypothetical protein DL96DRAFT_1581874 [Flagelloscypha sp. PMI_526]